MLLIVCRQLGWFANPIFHEDGDYPEVMKKFVAVKSSREGFPRSRLPVFTQDEIDYIRGTADFLGLNFYTTFLIKDAGEGYGEDVIFEDSKDSRTIAYQKDEWPKSYAVWLKVI